MGICDKSQGLPVLNQRTMGLFRTQYPQNMLQPNFLTKEKEDFYVLGRILSDMYVISSAGYDINLSEMFDIINLSLITDTSSTILNDVSYHWFEALNILDEINIIEKHANVAYPNSKTPEITQIFEIFGENLTNGKFLEYAGMKYYNSTSVSKSRQFIGNK